VSDAAGRLGAIRARIEAAAARAGREPGAARLVGASKMQSVATLAAFHSAGLRRFGENRVQEALAKAAELPDGIEWHLLGPLQSNKVRRAVEIFTWFHAVDRAKIALALDAEAVARGLVVTGLLEVNLGGEASKHGFEPAALAAEAEPLAELRGLRIAGLMAIPPPATSAAEARGSFRRLRELRDALDRRPEWAGRLVELSMGMSDDFEIAIEEGATWVRVGTALFGERPS